MKKAKAEEISIVLASVGVMLILLPVFGVFSDNQQGPIFAGVISFISAAVVRQIGK